MIMNDPLRCSSANSRSSLSLPALLFLSFYHFCLCSLISERGNAIAVSVRSFRVAGIKGLVAHDQDEAVTIQTAVQVRYLTFTLLGCSNPVLLMLSL